MVEVKIDGDEEAKSLQRFEELLLEAIEVARSAKFEPEIRDDDWNGRYLLIKIPSGRHSRSVILDTSDELERFIALEHDTLVFIDGLEAIVDFKQGVVEVGLQTVGAGATGSAANLFQTLESGHIDKDRVIDLVAGEAGNACQIGPPSDKSRLLCGRYAIRGVTLKVNTGKTRGNEQIKDMLVKLTNSLFLQIDLLFNHPLGMARARNAAIKGRAYKRKSMVAGEMQYPRHEYDDAPCSLYWYGRSASAMPLLQFLAFYQVVEFFYPVHSKAEINRRLKMILNDPSFRADRDSDLTRLVQALAPNRTGGLMDERSQLKAAITECSTSEGVRSFLISTDEKREFYKDGYKALSKVKVSLDERADDIRASVAERLYSIRCRIVHTKDDGNDKLGILLPYSKEEAALVHDIELMQFVARSVLVASGVRLYGK